MDYKRKYYKKNFKQFKGIPYLSVSSKSYEKLRKILRFYVFGSHNRMRINSAQDKWESKKWNNEVVAVVSTKLGIRFRCNVPEYNSEKTKPLAYQHYGPYTLQYSLVGVYSGLLHRYQL